MAVIEKDLIVLGSGPGGYVAAIRASQLGRKVTIVEKESLGGVCLNWGCIPSKALLKSAKLHEELSHAKDFGFEIKDITINFPKIIERSREVAGKLNQGVTYLMKKNNVEVVFGTGKLAKGNILKVTDKENKVSELKFKDVIIATGARAKILPGIEVDGKAIHTYRTALEYKTKPSKVLVIGAGAIGMEFAYFYMSLGAEVTVAEFANQILPVEDTELSTTLQKSFEKRGMKILTSTTVGSVTKQSTGASAVLKGPQGETKWQGDIVLCAVGVVPNTENIGLEEVGITKDERGFIKVNNRLETNLPHHFSIGDVTGKQMLAHKASHEALAAAENACGKNHHVDYNNIPGCTYCQPQVASIGLTEAKAKELGFRVKIGKMPFSAIGKAIAIGEPEGLTKVIIDAQTGEVLGVHILHAEATELIAEATVIRTHEGIAESVLDTVHPHPTLSESMAEAMALALGRPINF